MRHNVMWVNRYMVRSGNGRCLLGFFNAQVSSNAHSRSTRGPTPRRAKTWSVYVYANAEHGDLAPR